MVKKGKSISKQKPKQKKPEKEDKGKSYETTRRDLIISEDQKQDMEKEIPGMRVITPSTVAQKFGVRVSIAKAVLAELEARKLIKRISTGGKFKLYTKTSG